MSNKNTSEKVMSDYMINFTREIYQEHLEEASFLYEQRLNLSDDPEITWLDIEDFEERFEPHIDGLVVGGKMALDVCQIKATEGDFGELHAAVCVFCRKKRKDLVVDVLNQLDPDDSENINAFADALKYELPHDLENGFLQILSQGEQKLIPILSNLVGYRRIHDNQKLLSMLSTCPDEYLPIIIWAFGRLKDKQAVAILYKYLQHEKAPIRKNAALSLLRLGDQQTLNQCITEAHSQIWPHIPLALGGYQSIVNILSDPIRANNGNIDTILGLGLFGDVSNVYLLINSLDNPEVADSAAMALNLITGAELYEDAFVPDEFDEDELFEEELEDFKKDKLPTKADGEPFGENITRLSQDPDAWNKWWRENQKSFDPRFRYRNGKLYSPACLLENLEHEKSPRFVRQMAYEEFVIRYGIDFPFETDMFVPQQKQAITKYAEWVNANSQRFQPGKWYFAGKLIS